MRIRVLGAHNVESTTTGMVCLLVDDVLAIDTGALTSSLSFDEQKKIGSILISHCHYDHIRDVAAIAINMSYFQQTVRICSLPGTLEAIGKHVLNGVVYPRFDEIKTPDRPPVEYRSLEVGKEAEVEGHKVIPLPMQHAVDTVGYQVTSADGKSFFFTGDTGPGLARGLSPVSPQLLIADVTLPNRLVKHGKQTGHLTPGLLAEELTEFKRQKDYLPLVLLIHVSPMFENEIRSEALEVAKELDATLDVAYEGMTIDL